MDDRHEPRPAHELPWWRRIGRALTRAVWPIAGAKNDPWLADDSEFDPDMAHPHDEGRGPDEPPEAPEQPAPPGPPQPPEPPPSQQSP
jgi:hypothetical protein